MGDLDKSVVLSKLCGWLYLETRQENGKQSEYVICNYPGQSQPWGIQKEAYSESLNGNAWQRMTKNLYSQENMALAWRVLNWATKNLDDKFPNWYDDSSGTYGYPITSFVERSEFETWPPEKAQRAWLDLTLEFATKAGWPVGIPK